MGWRSLRVAWTGRRFCAASCGLCCWARKDGRFPSCFRWWPGGGIPRGARSAGGRGRPHPSGAGNAAGRHDDRSPFLLFQLPGLLAEADFVSVGTNDLMHFCSRPIAARRSWPTDMIPSPPGAGADGAAGCGLRRGASAAFRLRRGGRAALDAMAFAAVGVTTLSMSVMRFCRKGAAGGDRP